MSEELPTNASRVFRGIRGLIKNLSKELKVSKRVVADDILEFLEYEFGIKGV